MKTSEQIADAIVDEITTGGAIAFAGLDRSPTLHEMERAIVLRAIEADRAQHSSLDLDHAIEAWESAYAKMWDMADSFHASLNYSEAEALANLLVLADRHDLAIKLMEGWAEQDPEMAQEPTRAADLAAYLAARREHLCDECDQKATERWSNIAPPVKLCDECTHNAYRSGWEPGR